MEILKPNGPPEWPTLNLEAAISLIITSQD